MKKDVNLEVLENLATFAGILAKRWDASRVESYLIDTVTGEVNPEGVEQLKKVCQYCRRSAIACDEIFTRVQDKLNEHQVTND